MTALQQLQGERAMLDAAIVVELAMLEVHRGYSLADTGGVLTSTIAAGNETVGALRARAFAVDVEMAWYER